MKGFREYPELKKLIKEAGFTIKDVGFKVGESYSNIAGRLNGYLKLSHEMREEIIEQSMKLKDTAEKTFSNNQDE